MARYAYKKKSLIALFALVDAMGYLVRRPPPTAVLNPRRILIVRLDQMGDIVQTLPLVESVLRSFPDAQVHMLTTMVGAHIVNQAYPQVYTRVWECPWFDPRRVASVTIGKIRKMIRDNAYDCALEPRGDVRLIALLKSAGVKNIVGFNATGGGFLLDVKVPWVSAAHAVDKNLALVTAISGTPATTFPRFESPPLTSVPGGQIRIAVHPDAGTEAKKWPVSYFAETVSHLVTELGYRVVLIGSTPAIGRRIMEKVPSSVENLMGLTSFDQLMAVLRSCDGLISNDSGPAHLMAALGKPVWVVWSGTAPASIWAPRGSAVTLLEHPVECAPCSLPVCPVEGHPCLSEIKPDQVIESVKKAFA